MISTVKLLCDKGAQIEAKDRYGWTALRYAAEVGNLTIVNFLLDRGADMMSLDPSSRYGSEVEDLLFERGGLLFG
jgi:ankyrin repeat protein